MVPWPDANTLGISKLEICSHQAAVYFEVETADGVDCPQATPGVLMRQLKQRSRFPLVGTKDFVVKTSGAGTGRPLTPDDSYGPRHRKRHVKHAETTGKTN